MRKPTLGERFTRSKTIMLLVILVVLTFATMLISSGVLKGKPFTALFTDGFMARGNLISIFNNLIIQCVILCGISCLLIGGNIDLSVAGQATVAALIFAKLCANTAMPWGAALAITLAFGAVCGLCNTFLTNVLKFPAFIATIGMSSIYAGLANVWTSGANVQINRASFIKLGDTVYSVFPVLFIAAAVLMIVYQFILLKTPFGRKIYMVGGNPNAARLSGLNPDRLRMILFVNNSVLAALAGLMWASKNKLASPTAIIAATPDMRVISAAILGGVSFMGGSGDIGGAFVAVLLLNVFNNMLDVLGTPPYWNVFAQGAILVLALVLDYVSAKRTKAQLEAR